MGRRNLPSDYGCQKKISTVVNGNEHSKELLVVEFVVFIKIRHCK